jgi:hypothetical protein
LWNFCLGWPWNMIFLISTSQVGRVIDLSHHTWLFSVFLLNIPIYTVPLIT